MYVIVGRYYEDCLLALIVVDGFPFQVGLLAVAEANEGAERRIARLE